MADETTIGWTDRTFNPWWGCEKISPACDHCYAERDSRRYGFAEGGGNGPELWGHGSERRHLSEKNWNRPLVWEREAIELGRPLLVFCASMADVFEARDDLDADRARLWEIIEATPHLRWQLLTKRPEQVLRRIPPRWLGIETKGDDLMVQVDPTHLVPWQYLGNEERAVLAARPEAREAWPSNAWIGATVEDQQRAALRMPRLLAIPAPVRFLSCEPLFGDLDLDRWLFQSSGWHGELRGDPTGSIGWAIIGGESGPGHRYMDPRWARSLAEDFEDAGVPVYFKQVSGARSGVPGPDDLEALKAFPAEAGERGAPVEIR